MTCELIYAPPANNMLFFAGNNDIEIIRICSDGNIFWKKRLVETDSDFKAAMLDLVEYIRGNVKNG